MFPTSKSITPPLSLFLCILLFQQLILRLHILFIFLILLFIFLYLDFVAICVTASFPTALVVEISNKYKY